MTTTTLLKTLNTNTNTNPNSLTYLELTINNLLGEPKKYDDLEEMVEEALTTILKKYKTLEVISEESGEILYTINLTNSEEVTIPKFEEKIYICGGEEAGGDTPTFSTNADKKEYREWKESMAYELDGFFSAKNVQTYMKDGIRQHKTPMDGFWSEMIVNAYCTAEFRTMDDEVTDSFYGSCNDFTEWFNAKAIKGEKFKVYVECDGEMHRVGNVNTWIGKTNGGRPLALKQRLDGTWAV